MDEYNNLIRFHNLVNQGKFEFEHRHVFAVSIQPKLYNWFKTNELLKIQKQISCWLSALYYFNFDKREILKNQLYKPLFEEVTHIINIHFNDFPLPNFNQHYNNYNSYTIEEIKACEKKYIQVCKDFYDDIPPVFLNSPFDYELKKDWGTNTNYGFDFIEAYLSESDWKRIINGKSKDDMNRAESLDDLWIKWKHVFTTFDQRKNFVYSFYFDINSLKTKRDHIPQKTKDSVWRRDDGKCTQCSSRLRLEYDHIIPISKGGTSTYRNLQLLCESCNRKKSNNI
ncbi:HNH endonuclease [bacterium SCSIO 12643]|nr:HNH endonuclease [bacterium SCSIO 12643]